MKSATSSPSRWTCSRAPSSFESTAAGPVLASAAATSAAVPASIGASGRPTSSRIAARPSRPSRSAIAATAARSPCSVSARRSSLAGHPGRARRGVGHDARERALAQVAQQQPHEEVLLRRARPRQQRLHGAHGAPRPIPAPRSAPIAPSARSSSATVSVASAAGAGRSRSSAAADADLALRELAREPAHDRRDLVGPGAREQRGEHADLLVARLRRGHRGGRVDELAQAHARQIRPSKRRLM